MLFHRLMTRFSLFLSPFNPPPPHARTHLARITRSGQSRGVETNGEGSDKTAPEKRPAGYRSLSNGVETVRTRHHCHGFLQCEPGVWLVMVMKNRRRGYINSCLAKKKENEISSQQVFGGSCTGTATAFLVGILYKIHSFITVNQTCRLREYGDVHPPRPEAYLPPDSMKRNARISAW